MSQTTLDPYAELGVPRGANAQQVRAAYRRLAKSYHPDLHPEAGMSQRMQRVNEAWEILSSPSRRANYDLGSARPASPGYSHWSVPRPPPVAPGPMAWAGAGARPSSATARANRGPVYRDSGYGAPDYPPYEEDGRRWSGVLATVIIGVLLFAALLVGILPPPLGFIGVLVLARVLLGSLDDR